MQVANFDMVAAAEPEQQQQPPQEALPVVPTSQPQFWASLLKDHKPVDQPDTAAAAAAAGGSNAATMGVNGGSRRRRAAAAAFKPSYLEDGLLEDWDEDISSSSSEEEEGQGGKGRRGKKRKHAEEEDEAWELPAEQVKFPGWVGLGWCLGTGGFGTCCMYVVVYMLLRVCDKVE